MEGQQGVPGRPLALPAGQHLVWKEWAGGNPNLMQEEGKNKVLNMQGRARKVTRRRGKSFSEVQEDKPAYSHTHWSVTNNKQVETA